MSGAPAHAARLRLVVRGRVQGVGFRWYVREAARSRGLAGWVRNNPDGSVELEAAGRPAALAQLRAVVAVGPHGARVESVDEGLPAAEAVLPFPFAVER